MPKKFLSKIKPMKKILVIDNYDSFTYNLVHYIEAITQNSCDVKRNNEVEVQDIDSYSHLVFSPGPGLPEEAGKMIEIIKTYNETKKILGVCLGHQALGVAFGGKLKNLSQVFHGVETKITKTKEDELFKDIPNQFEVGRYHSWVIEKSSLPDCFDITSLDEDGEIMSISHKTLPIKGVQFHPESIMTSTGMNMMKNFLEL